VNGHLFDLVLVLDVLLEHRDGRSADGEEAVCAAPKNRFPVVFFDVVGKLFPDQARRDRF